jgi:LAGLIDADG endonuclease
MRPVHSRHVAICSGPPTLAPRDGHFLAGFVDAEGSFRLRPNNGGASWSCGFTLVVRDDDGELLLDLRELTGLGNVSSLPAARTSKPQAVWSIDSRFECLWLAELLEQFPLRGRKRRELAVWAEAVREIDRGRPSDRLPLLAGQLRSLKRYDNSPSGQCTAGPLDDALIGYLGGFFTGEGHLALNGTSARVVVRLRDDDRPLLEHLASATALGKLYSSPRSGSTCPAAIWTVFRRDQLRDAADLLGSAGLRGRKAHELPIWRSAALELVSAHAERRRPRDEVLSTCGSQLRKMRHYRPRAAIESPSRRARQRDRYLRTLRAAAAATSGALTVTQYNTLRRSNPRWPNRNTIARAFGGWSEALVAAGLAERRGRRRGGSCREPAEFTTAQLEHRLAERRRVVDLVANLSKATGSTPTVHEYLAWRIANDTTLPCLAKLYDLFPGGWSSVNALAGRARRL